MRACLRARPPTEQPPTAGPCDFTAGTPHTFCPPSSCIEAAGHGKAWKQEVQEAGAWCSWRKQADLVPSAIRVGGWRPRGPLSHSWRQVG